MKLLLLEEKRTIHEDANLGGYERIMPVAEDEKEIFAEDYEAFQNYARLCY